MSKFTEINQNTHKTMPELGQRIPDVIAHFSSLIATASREGALDKKPKNSLPSASRLQAAAMAVLPSTQKPL